MTQPTSPETSPHAAAMRIATGEPRDLLARTLRSVALLVGSCVLFVGVLSVSAVVITDKAVGADVPGGLETSQASGRASKPASDAAPGTNSAAPKKPVLSPARGDVGPHPI